MDPSSRQYQGMPNNNPKPRPQPDQALKCPRCDSTNTKFCYYNNYSLSQPRYFCKSCRRYWTKGGTLRNVPVGGGCRKNRRSSSSSSKRGQDIQPLTLPNTSIPLLGYDTTDPLSLAFARLQKQQPNLQHLGFDDPMLANPNSLPFIQNQNNFLGFYNYESLAGEVDNGGGNMGVSEEMMMMIPYNNNNNNNNNEDMNNNVAITTTSDVTATTVKHELCNGKESELNRSVLWGLPWQLGEGDHGNDYNIGETWSGVNSAWHGLINSTLM